MTRRAGPARERLGSRVQNTQECRECRIGDYSSMAYTSRSWGFKGKINVKKYRVHLILSNLTLKVNGGIVKVKLKWKVYSVFSHLMDWNWMPPSNESSRLFYSITPMESPACSLTFLLKCTVGLFKALITVLVKNTELKLWGGEIKYHITFFEFPFHFGSILCRSHIEILLTISEYKHI